MMLKVLLLGCAAFQAAAIVEVEDESALLQTSAKVALPETDVTAAVLVAATLAETVKALNSAAMLGLADSNGEGVELPSVQQLRAIGEHVAKNAMQAQTNEEGSFAHKASAKLATEARGHAEEALTLFRKTVTNQVNRVMQKYSHAYNLDNNLRTTRLLVDSAALVWKNLTGIDNGAERAQTLMKLVGQIYRFGQMEMKQKQQPIHEQVTNQVDHVLKNEIAYASDFIYKQVKSTTYDAVKQASMQTENSVHSAEDVRATVQENVDKRLAEHLERLRNQASLLQLQDECQNCKDHCAVWPAEPECPACETQCA